ncbi:MAG TPA: prepilin-type N-terminal cleavage/methylation domain-containing protein [Candidatus Moranbacteria bacterium]|nr:prepilin-type N-terminal cleavage/methylation domain-containing protein [Candidatus Moranbacteria bacterium]
MKNYSDQKNSSGQKGFTLIEVVLVLFLVSMVFLTIYMLFVSTIKHDTESRYEIIASNLAQEGIEIIRNMRDENVMKNVGVGDVQINEGVESSCNPHFSASGDNACSALFGLALDGNNVYRPEIDNDNVKFYRGCKLVDPTITGGDGRVQQFIVECEVCWKSFTGAGEGCGIEGGPSGQGFRSVRATALLSDWLN